MFMKENPDRKKVEGKDVKESHDVSLYDCVKSVQIRSFLWSAFSGIWTEYGDFRCKSPYLV